MKPSPTEFILPDTDYPSDLIDYVSIGAEDTDESPSEQPN